MLTYSMRFQMPVDILTYLPLRLGVWDFYRNCHPFFWCNPFFFLLLWSSLCLPVPGNPLFKRPPMKMLNFPFFVQWAAQLHFSLQEQLFLNMMHNRGLQTLKRSLPFIFLRASRVKKKKGGRESKCLMSARTQYSGTDVTLTHSPILSAIALSAQVHALKKCMRTCKLFTSHAQTVKSVKWSCV